MAVVTDIITEQRPGGTSGAHNRSLCRSAPVLSHYPVAGTDRLADVPDIPAGRFGSSPSCSRPAAGGACSCLRPGRAAGSARTIPSRLRLLLRRWPSASRCRWDGSPAQPRCGSGSVAPQGFSMSPVSDWIRQDRAMHVPWTGNRPVMYPVGGAAGRFLRRNRPGGLVRQSLARLIPRRRWSEVLRLVAQGRPGQAGQEPRPPLGHRAAVDTRRAAIARLLPPSALASTIRARKARPCAALRRLAQFSSVCRSSSDNTSGASLGSGISPAHRTTAALSPPSGRSETKHDSSGDGRTQERDTRRSRHLLSSRRAQLTDRL